MIQPLAWEPPYAAGAAIKSKQKKKKKERKKERKEKKKEKEKTPGPPGPRFYVVPQLWPQHRSPSIRDTGTPPSILGKCLPLGELKRPPVSKEGQENSLGAVLQLHFVAPN